MFEHTYCLDSIFIWQITWFDVLSKVSYYWPFSEKYWTTELSLNKERSTRQKIEKEVNIWSRSELRNACVQRSRQTYWKGALGQGQKIMLELTLFPKPPFACFCCLNGDCYTPFLCFSRTVWNCDKAWELVLQSLLSAPQCCANVSDFTRQKNTAKESNQKKKDSCCFLLTVEVSLFIDTSWG